MHIILVEDNKADAFYIEELLDESDVSLTLKLVIDNGIDAINYFSKLATDINESIILLDINLPGNNGFEILEHLRKYYPKEALNVAILSTSDSDEDRQKAEKLGANQYFNKPLCRDSLKKLESLSRKS